MYEPTADSHMLCMHMHLQLLELRDRLTKAKHEKDALRARNNALKAQQGFTGSDLLVADYEKRKVAY